MIPLDITDTLAPKSDQLDAIDLVSGPRTFTVADVSRGNDEQPVNIRLVEFPRVWRPSKGMRRVLAFCWGPDASLWAGRRVTLYCDPEVSFGRDKVGGTRISHLSHIDGPKNVPMLVSKGRAGISTVKPLVESPPPAAPNAPTPEQVAATNDVNLLRAGLAQFPHLRDLIEARIAELEAGGA